MLERTVSSHEACSLEDADTKVSETLPFLVASPGSLCVYLCPHRPRGSQSPTLTFGTCGGGDLSGSGPNVIDDGVLEPGDPGEERSGTGIGELPFPSFCPVSPHHSSLGLLLPMTTDKETLFSLWRTALYALLEFRST